MGIVEKIKEIEAEIARTQKNKATEHHLGGLKAKLAKLRTQLLEPSSKGEKGEGFDVKKFGDARVALIGFPRYHILYDFFTYTKQCGKVYASFNCYRDRILCCSLRVYHSHLYPWYHPLQRHKDSTSGFAWYFVLYSGPDLSGIIEGAAHGKGRGRQVIAVAKSSDLILMVLDAAKERGNRHKEILEKELHTVGLRLNQKPPNVTVNQKPGTLSIWAQCKLDIGGGVKFATTVNLTKLGPDPKKTIYSILHEYKMHNCEVLIREDISIDQFIDVIEVLPFS